jgi:hypothetical protein
MHMQRDIDKLIARVRRDYPAVQVEQLLVAHPAADDDGLWFLKHPGSSNEVQVESSTGAAPFIVESNQEQPADAATIDEALGFIVARLGLGSRSA